MFMTFIVLGNQIGSAPALQFKGSGWYVTDYAGKSAAKSAGEASEGSTADSGKKEESTSTETKPGEAKATAGNEGSKKRKK